MRSFSPLTFLRAFWAHAPHAPLPPLAPLPAKTACVVLACLGPNLPTAAAQEQPAAPPPPSVAFVEVASAAVAVVRDYPARLVALQDVEVRAQTGGIIAARLFQEGTAVEAGETLYELDAEAHEIAVFEARAGLASAQSVLDFAEAEVARFAPLAAHDIASRRQLQQLEQQRDAAAAGVQEAQARLAAAQLDLHRTRIRAPIGGHAGLAQADAGALVVANQTLLVSIVQRSPIGLQFHPPARDLPLLERYRADAPLQVSLFLPHDGTTNGNENSDTGTPAESSESMPGHGFAAVGVLDFIDNRIAPATDSILVRASFDNEDGSLRPGQFARARVHIGSRADALLVPRKAVQQRQGEYLLYMLDDQDRLEERRVALGGISGLRRIILDGVAAGERVIVSDVSFLRAGMQVAPHPVLEADSSTIP